MKIAYFGTPYLAAHLLEKVIADTEMSVAVKLVVTAPDARVGKKQILTASPVKKVAQKYRLPVFDADIAETQSLTNLVTLIKKAKIDLALLFAYGKLIPEGLLRAPVRGFWNIHPSLLPKFRGATPLTYPLLLGVKDTGVTLMQMDTELDHGPMLAQATYAIKPPETRVDLEQHLIDLGFELFKKVMLSETNASIPQDPQQATYTRPLDKKDGYIAFALLQKALRNESVTFPDFPDILRDYYKANPTEKPLFELPAVEIVLRLYKALIGWPGIWTYVKINRQEKRLKITNVDLKSTQFKIVQVQLEGKNPVSFIQFNAAYKIFSKES